MSADLRRERLAIAALVAGALCIAFAPIFVRLSEVPPTATAFGRMLLAVPLFALWSWRVDRGPRPAGWDRARVARGVFLAGFCFAGDLAVWHWSIHYTTVANATLLANFAPIFVTLGAWLFLGERVTGGFLVGMAAALGGAGLLVRASFDLGGEALKGDLLGLLTAVFYGGYLVSVKHARQALPTPTLMAGSTAVSCALLLPVTWAAGEPLLPSTPRGFAVIAALAWVSQVAGQGLIAYGLAHLPASFSSVTLLVQPATAALLAWAIFGERLGGTQAFGGALVLGGILMARRASRGGGTSTEVPGDPPPPGGDAAAPEVDSTP